MVFLFMDAEIKDQIDELSSHFGKADLVPVVTRLPGDLLTPVAAYCALAGRSRKSFLFESVEGGEHLARYSFIGSDPEFSVRETDQGLSVFRGKTVEREEGSVLDFLRASLPLQRVAPIEGLPSFLGGAVGFLDYAVSRQIEPVLAKGGAVRTGGVGSEFMFFRHIVAFDHVRQTINIVTLVFANESESDPERFRKALADALERNRVTAERLNEFRPSQGKGRDDEPHRARFKSNFSRDGFEASVEKVKELISAGECYQVVLSQCFSRTTAASPIEIYRAIRSLNPSPYMFLVDFGDRAVIGASPEMLVRCRERKLEYRPIAGTRPRGSSPEEDAALALEMLADEKEVAEHRMLVDLGRNDLGRVAEFGSVKIDDLMSVEKFSHVQHIVSAISGRLRPGLEGFDALAACFPAGTVTGAPKVRAMQIISELEPTERGVYSGAVGYFDHQGNIDTCIAIRTVYLEGGVAKIQAGAGIVADSVPTKEFEETEHKAAALMRAIELAETGRFAIAPQFRNRGGIRVKATGTREVGFSGLCAKLESGIHLDADEASELFDRMRSEADVGKLASLLEAWSGKGYSVEEIAACAAVLRREVKKVECHHEVFLDVVGTGGSRSKTFNVSTAAAFVVSGAGLPVAKHGNRAASSKTGSADALEELCVELSGSAAAAARSLRNHGICFMFAPHFHNLTKELAEARRAVGGPTIFNLLGPAANPAGAPYQLIGIWDGTKARDYGEALRRLGTKRTWIVHGNDGLDEITLNGATSVTEVTENGIDNFEISPSDFGLKEASMEGLNVNTPSESVDVILEVLNSYDDGPARDLVAMNAGAALYIAGLAEDLKEGLAMAEESIDSGEALQKLRLLVEEARK